MSGSILLKVDYMGRLNRQMAGFYISRYVVEDEERTLAVTQFEESDARRAIPCLDEPEKKATFEVEMIVAGDQVAISNMPVAEERAIDGGKKRVRFEQTPRMSTYLLFFGAGDFAFIQDETDGRVRAATTPGMTGHAARSLELGRKSLQFCEEYYGIPYPLPKMDLIAVADFAFGAMENWGAITFRENLLLHFPGITSKAATQRIFEVIAHEIAHQWFGNLVTPSDWKYLWLNESFATLFGNRVVAHFQPGWEVWPQFLHTMTATAMDRDSLLTTVPIESSGGEHVVINEVTAAIIYNKGASILRQVEAYIGEDKVREGLRLYLGRHAYNCAASHHLWEALEEASEMPVTRMMRGWIEQKGFPLLEATRDQERLHLKQRRFTYLQGDATDGKWLVPVTARVFDEKGGWREISTLLEEKEGALEIGADAFACKINWAQTGFYRVKYQDEDSLGRLGELVVQRRLPPEDRWGLQGDLYALAKSGEATVDDYLDFLSHYAAEDSFLPLMGMVNSLFETYLITSGERRQRVARIGRALAERVLAAIGYEPDTEEAHTTSMLRDQMIMPAVIYGAEEITGFAADRFASLMRGEPVHPDLLKSVMSVGAFTGGERAFQWFDERLQSTESEHERMNIMMALGSFRDRDWIDRARQYILDRVPDRNKFVPICRMALNPEAISDMWDWFTSQLNRMEQLHPVHFERVIAAVIPLSGLGRKEEIESFVEGYLATKDKAGDAIRMAMEKLAVYSRMRDT
jgi:tricorn protease interacting factor F2/3